MEREESEFRDLQLTIVRARMAFRRYLQRTLRRHGVEITFEMLQVLGSLWHEPDVTQRALAVRISRDKASLSSLMGRMERKGYILRREHPSDRRNKLVRLTPEGEALWERVVPILDGAYARTGQRFGTERLRCLTDGLADLAEQLDHE